MPRSSPPQSSRPLVAVPPSTLSLAGEWRFAIDPASQGQALAWSDPEFDDSAWAMVTVPHTWNVMAEHFHYEGLAWYRRRFLLPDTAQVAHLRLIFAAIFYRARVWLNGADLGTHEGGYTAFAFDVSGMVNPGGENLLAVQVDNRRAPHHLPATLRPGWSFDWWNYGGIVRDVSLQLSSRAFIKHQRLVAVPHLIAIHDADVATITATLTVSNTSTEVLVGTLSGDVLDDATGLSALPEPLSAAMTLSPGQSTDVQLSTTIARPQLWHFDHPHLYRWSASLQSATGQGLHVAEVRFGIRAVELKDAQVYLNGEPVRLVGLTRHADSPGHGLAETVVVMATDYADLKQLNTVLSRPAHYPQADFILDYADRAGILLVPEVPAWQLTAAQMADSHLRELERQQLREMIDTHGNHPSVWAWSLGNEVESKSRAGHAFIRDMIAYVKTLDPTRPIGFASNLLNKRPEDDATAMADFVLMNQYFGTWGGPKDRLGPALDAIHATWPEKPVIISEYGFEPHWQRIWKWGPLRRARYYWLAADVPPDSEEADLQRRRLIREQMATLRQKSFVAGVIFWTYQDYRTPTRYTMGVVDAQRRRRGSWDVLRDEYAPVLIDSVNFASASDDLQNTTVRLRTRGPLECDMPAYTLHGYTLRWVVEGMAEREICAHGSLPLPTLEPGTTWSTQLEWSIAVENYRLTLRIVRPTGFSVLERSYDCRGKPRQDSSR
jgi:beta-galactosidase/beta-glucuronidase